MNQSELLEIAELLDKQYPADWFKPEASVRRAAEALRVMAASVPLSESLPDFMQRIEQCIVGANVKELTDDWAPLVYTSQELAEAAKFRVSPVLPVTLVENQP